MVLVLDQQLRIRKCEWILPARDLMLKGNFTCRDGKKAKKLAAKAKQTAPAFSGVKPPEMLVLEEKIEQQGAKVRAVKANTEEGNVAVELASLQELKSEMNIMIERLSSASLENKS